MAVPVGGGGGSRSGGNPVNRGSSNPFAPKPAPREAPKDKKVVVGGVTFIVKPDGRIIAPNGKALPKGTTLKTGTVQANGSRKVIGFNGPKGKKITVKNGTVTVTTGGKSVRGRANEFVSGEDSGKRPTTTVIYGKPAAGKTAPRSGDDRRPQVPTSPARPAAPRAPTAGGRPPAAAAPAAPRSTRNAERERVKQLQRDLNARGAGLVVDGIYGPKTRAAEQRFGGAAAPRPAAAPRAAAPATSRAAAPATPRGAAPAASPAAAPAARPGAAPVSKNVDALVRQMFGDVAAFLSDPELGPILRKAATEGWDNSRLFGALQQTKFWRTKADSERKWIILNRLDNATARRDVERQAQGIWDLTRQTGLNLSGLQVHDLAVNALKFGWTPAEIREQAFNAVNGKEGSLSTSVATQYGYLAAFLDNPEVGPMLERAAREGWNMPRLEAELQKTNFWKTTTDAQRRFNATQEQSPAEAQQAVSARASELLTLAQSLGVQVDPDKLQRIAEDSLRFGWNSSQTRAAITAEFDYQGGESGLAGQSSREIKRMAADYLVPISDQVLEKWTEQIVAGTADMEGFNAYLVEQAKSLFPGMASALDRGITVAQYTDPYKQLAARELELAPEQVDLNDPRFRTMLDQVNSKGERVAMTLSESAEYLRKLPEWQQTRGANEKAASLTENILKTFGAVA